MKTFSSSLIQTLTCLVLTASGSSAADEHLNATAAWKGLGVNHKVRQLRTGPAVVSFTLIDVSKNSDEDMPVLQDGAVVSTTSLGMTSLNVRADTNNEPIGSVVFGLNENINYRTESVVPYALGGDSVGDFYEWDYIYGVEYTLTATPYSGGGGSGTAGTPKQITFTVIQDALTTENPTLSPTPAPMTPPTQAPTLNPSQLVAETPAPAPPTENPTLSPTSVPTTETPTLNQTPLPTQDPPSSPTASPTLAPAPLPTENPTLSVTTAPTESSGPAVVSFTLIDVSKNSDEDMPVLQDGAVVSTTSLGMTSLNVRAVTNNEPIGSVVFGLNENINYRTESVEPYALAGDSVGDFYEWDYIYGVEYTLTATPYSGGGGSGTAGTPKQITFTVIQDALTTENPTLSPTLAPMTPPTQAPTLNPTQLVAEPAPAPPTENPTLSPTSVPTTETPTLNPIPSPTQDPPSSPTASPTLAPAPLPTENPTLSVTTAPTESSGPAVVSFTLIDVSKNSDEDMPVLQDGAVVSTTSLGMTSLNVRAVTNNEPIGSVVFGLNENFNYRTESVEPYALAGDSVGDYYEWDYIYGVEYTLTATPYSGGGGSGTAGTPKQITFTVIQDALTTENPTLSPTPAPMTPPTQAPTPNPSQLAAETSAPVTPTENPTLSPTSVPTTETPTLNQTPLPTQDPASSTTSSPTQAPTPLPTQSPTLSPTPSLTLSPNDSPTPNPTIAPVVPGMEPVISEFLALNADGLMDGNGEFSDWIEIHNPDSTSIDLAGWHLTDKADDLTRWTFPENSVVEAGGYAIVFASGATNVPAGEWHVGFSLKGSGEYLALVKPDGVTVVMEFAPKYPEQREGISYGRSTTAGDDTLYFFTNPSPGKANNGGLLGFVGEPQFSHGRGFFNDSFDLEISAPQPGATIRYTLDGSEPSITHGATYASPLSMITTTIVRARAFMTGFLQTNIITQTYLFLDDVIIQPATIPDWPNNVYSLGQGSGTHDYEMDPVVVQNPAYSGKMVDALKAIPTMSIATDRGGMFGSSGFYDGEDEEKAASIEVIYPNAPQSSEQVDGGIEGHSHIRMKRSLRINFGKVFGATSFETALFDNMPWNPPGVPKRDRLILRAGNNRAWSRSWSKEKNTYCEDELSRQTQLAVSGYGMRGAFVHLYINGLYWGLYNVVERADEHFTSRYFGGEPEDWYARNHGGTISGASSRYNYLTGTLKDKDMSNPASYAELVEYLDPTAFIDYLLVQWLTATGDWPGNNWYAGHRLPSSPLGSTPLLYFVWDSEWSWDLPFGESNPPPYDPWVHIDFRAGRTKNEGPTIARLFNSAKDSPEFLRLLSDRGFHHLFHGREMSDDVMQARFGAITDSIRDAVIAESARWGDTLEPMGEPVFIRDVHWQNEVDTLTGLMPGRAAKMVAALRAEGYYPSIDPPAFSQHGGQVTLPFSLVLSNPNVGGLIVYTLDGSDPADGGAISFSGPILITESVQVRTRIQSDGEWSALDEAVFTVLELPALRITEIMYNPPPLTTGEIAAGYTDKDEFEYLELFNRGDQPVDMEGMQFTEGVIFTFPTYSLAPGERVLIVSNPAAFVLRYGEAATVLGSYAPTGLKNSGERLRLESALGEEIADFSYDDSEPWPVEADGDGYSLVFVDGPPDTDPAVGENWQASALPGGSPGW